MTSGRMSRRAILGAGAVTLLGPAILSQQGRAALPVRGTPPFTPHTAVKNAMLNRWSGIFNVADMGGAQTLLLVVGGVATEVHARRAGVYLPKQPGATSPKIVSPARYDQLLHASGGVDVPVTTSPAKVAFAQLVDAPASGSTPHAPALACPSDFATMKPIQQAAIKAHLSDPANQKYAPCFGSPLSETDPFQELFGAPAAHAEGDTLVFLRISVDDFFDQWTVSYDPQQGFYGFNLFGIRAIWSIG
jgi:hypothetical protein